MLLFLLKIVEKLMYARLDSYQNTIIFLCAFQFGFRKNSKLSDAIVKFLEYVYSSFESKQSTIAVYLDFLKALDKVNSDMT